MLQGRLTSERDTLLGEKAALQEQKAQLQAALAKKTADMSDSVRALREAHAYEVHEAAATAAVQLQDVTESGRAQAAELQVRLLVGLATSWENSMLGMLWSWHKNM